jgi:hypothetical protein
MQEAALSDTDKEEMIKNRDKDNLTTFQDH